MTRRKNIRQKKKNYKDEFQENPMSNDEIEGKKTKIITLSQPKLTWQTRNIDCKVEPTS